MAGTLYNRLVDACVVVGMDEQTGLLPLPNISRGDQDCFNNSDVLGPFQLNVLGVLTGSTAFFPCQQEQLSGGDYYSESNVICPCVASNAPEGHGRKLRRSMSYAPTAMPFSAEVVQSLPPFCFPDGGFAYKTAQEPHMHYLVLTNMDGGRTYCCGLVMTRKFGATEVTQLSNAFDLVLETDNKSTGSLHIPFCVCLVSKWPYFNTMKDLLSSLLAKLRTKVFVWPTIMKFTSHVAGIMAPPPGNLSIEVELFKNTIFVPSADKSEESVVDLDLQLPLLLLPFSEIIKVISCILTEQRMIFIFGNQALIPIVIESFFTFIEPFKWRRTYVPVLPHKLADLIEAPGPFIMGCHSRLRNHIKQVIRMEEIPSIVVVDLDRGIVEESPKEKIVLMPDNIAQSFSVRLRLMKYLYDIECIKIPTFYDVIEAKLHKDRFYREFRQNIRDACLEMMVSLFAEVSLFTRVGQKIFDKEGFLKARLEQDELFFRQVSASDAFERFIDDRLENPSQRDTFAVLAEKVVNTSNSLTRKRSTTNLMRSALKTTHSRSGGELMPKTFFKQPKFLKEGIHNGKYFGKCIKKLSSEVENKKGIALKASYLYLRGMLHLASNQLIDGLKDFHALYSANQELFPSAYVQTVVADLDPSAEESLKQQDFYMRAATLRIFKKKTEEQSSGRPLRKLPSSPLNDKEFEKLTRGLQIVFSSETAERLFAALTHKKAKEVTPDQFAQLYNTFTKIKRELEVLELPGLRLIGDEELVISSPLINTTRGMGRIFVTTTNLFFVGDGVRDTIFIMKLHEMKEVLRYQHYVVFPPGVAALRVVNKEPKSATFFACLKDNRDFWVTVLNEMAGASEIAFSFKDRKVVFQAANNVTLMNALVQMGVAEKVAAAVCSFARKRNADHEELSDETRESLERRLDPCIREPKRTTVTSLTYVSRTTQDEAETIWCGLGSGTIIVYEIEEWTIVSELRYASHRISCLVPGVGIGMVWAGSFDTVIYVINTTTRKAEQQLQQHTDFVSDIVYYESTDGEYDAVWSASFCGQIIRWDPESMEVRQEISLGTRTKTLSKIMIHGEKIWCGSLDGLFVVDGRSGDVIKKLQRIDDIGLPIPMECYSTVSEKRIWAFGRQAGALYAWETDTLKCHYFNLGEDLKASTIMPIGNKVWIGDKDGKVFILDAHNFTEDRNLHAHTDKVTCICVTEEGHVVTGSSSKEGKLCVWNTLVKNSREEAHSLGYDVLDGRLEVKSKLRPKRESKLC